MIRIFTSKPQRFGERGEQEAVRYLLKKGFAIVGRNISTPFGEIDIVARKHQHLYFFEVKSGKVGAAVSPAENLHPRKLGKLYRSVEYYRMRQGVMDYHIQGLLVLQNPNGTYTVEAIEVT